MSNLDFNLGSTARSQYSQLQDQLLASGPLAATRTDSATFTAEELLTARDSILFIDCDQISDIFLGVDTAANAADLLGNLGLLEVGDQCLLKFATATADIGNSILLANASGTANNVIIEEFSANPLDGQTLFIAAAAATGDGVASSLSIVRVTATNVTAGSEVITFNILVQGRPSAA